MALDSTLASIPADGFSLKLGTAWYDGSRWWAVVGGNPLGARWADPTQAVQGMNVLVGIINEGRGQSSAVVLSGVTEQPRPSSGQITAVGVDELLFAGDDGGVYATKRYLGAVSDYAVLDPVQLIWTMGNPTVLGIIGEVAVPPPAPPPPPPPVIATGTEVLTVTATDTWSVNGWGKWALQGERVYVGSLGGYTVTGSFFYGAPRPALQGKTITAIRFRIPQRLSNVGNYNAPATVHLYAHTSQARPGGDVARVAGPFDISVTAGQGPSWVNISSAHPSFAGIASTLAAGGGISFAGDPYTGWTSRLTDPLAGQIELDWSA